MASTDAVVLRPRGTAWGAVLCGWLASVGMMALLAPVVGASFVGRGYGANDAAAAVPPIVGVMIAYLVGGYVAGRMAGFLTSWHGMLSAFFGLFVVLGAVVLGIAADRGVLGDLRMARPDLAFPWAFPAVAAAGDALTFGAILGFLASIFAGWLGGVLAPERIGMVARTVTERPVRVGRTTVASGETASGFRLLPAMGRKGGERIETKEERIERRDLS